MFDAILSLWGLLYDLPTLLVQAANDLLGLARDHLVLTIAGEALFVVAVALIARRIRRS